MRSVILLLPTVKYQARGIPNTVENIALNMEVMSVNKSAEWMLTKVEGSETQLTFHKLAIIGRTIKRNENKAIKLNIWFFVLILVTF